MISSIMAKLYSTIIQLKISSYAEHKQALGHASFRTRLSTINQLDTLRAMREERRQQGKTLSCCFVDFKKANDIVPKESALEKNDRDWNANRVYNSCDMIVCERWVPN